MQRIFVLQVPQELQPKRQAFSDPSHNRDYGIEQDFVAYLDRHPESRARSAAEADWHYLPVFWTRWHLNHDGKKVTATICLERRQKGDSHHLSGRVKGDSHHLS
ncbi:MAG: hypothetical protein WCH77_00405 [Planctomycetota bacterium]